MRAKSEIRTELESKLNDDIWKKLKNSLLGRELIAFGAEVISENENVKDTMLLQLNPETADKYGLYLLSQMNEIPITNKKPSAVVVEMSDNSKTFAPYELTYSVGNVHFTNIEYTMRGKTVSLLNGNHKCYVKGGMAVTAQTYGEETYFYDGGDSYYGIRIGNAYPDSIIVVDENEIEIPRYTSDIALAETVGVMYKVVTGVDGGIYIRFVCRENYEAPATYRIDWLDHDAMEFDIDDNTTVTVNNTDVAEIKYTSTGSVDDLNFMRLQLKKEMAKYNGFNTPSSVERYVRGLPYILDAKCEKNDNGINIYVKPSSQLDLETYLDFSEVAAHISLNSILFPNIKVRTGKQIAFGIEISGVDDAKLQNGIKNLLQEKFSYENMTFNTVINTSNILAEIYAKYGIVPTVNLTIREEFAQNKPLSFKPIKNTLKLYNNENVVVAWEENNILYGMRNANTDIPLFAYEIVGSMGTMFLYKLKSKYTKSDAKTINGWDAEDAAEYDTYEHTISYDVKDGYNKFYIYDASTDVLKPFDSTVKAMLYSDTNPKLKYGAWDTDTQTFGNLLDIEFLSTNNALVAHLVFKSSGAEAYEDDNQNRFLKYWNTNNVDLYSAYLNGSYYSNELDELYRGKFQSVLFFDNPVALKNLNYESWHMFQPTEYGNEDGIEGFYTGLRNKNIFGDKLNVKSNYFVYNNKSYYAYNISKDFVDITNGTKKMTIKLNGEFLGMFPYENDLYVINPKYITRIVGFESFKEKEEIYQIYKDFNSTMTITQIIREFDNQIVLRSTDGWYTATGFEIVNGNKVFFANIQQIFNDEGLEMPNDTKLGGCTGDYVVAYEYRESMSTTEENKSGYVFYCYDIKNKVTKVTERLSGYEYTGDTTDVHEPVVEEVAQEYPLLTYATSAYGGMEGKYFYGYAGFGSDGQTLVVRDLPSNPDIFVYMWESYDVFSKGVAYVIIKDGYGIPAAYPIIVYKMNGDNKVPAYGGSFYSSMVANVVADIECEDDYTFIKPFVRHCIGKVMNRTDYKNNTHKQTTDKKYVGDAEYTTTTTLEYSGSEDFALPKLDSTEAGYHWYETYVSGDLYKMCCYRYNMPHGLYFPVTMLEIMVKNKANGNWTDDPLMRDYFSWQFFITQTITTQLTIRTNGELIVNNAEVPQELVKIGYFDDKKNSCITDNGCEISTTRYYTQNPNIMNDSYLVLDKKGGDAEEDDYDINFI